MRLAILNPPRTRGVGATPLTVFRDCSEHVRDRELKFVEADPSFKPHLLAPDSLSCQVRSLTYDVICKPLHCPKVSWFHSAAKATIFARGRWNFQNVLGLRRLIHCTSRIFHSGNRGSDQSRDLPIMSMEKYWNYSFCSKNDIILSMACTILLLHGDP